MKRKTKLFLKKELTIGDVADQTIRLETWALAKGFPLASKLFNMARRNIIEEAAEMEDRFHGARGM